MNVGRAFGFVFLDPRWFGKLSLAAALLLVPIVGWLLVFGYWMRLTRGVVARRDVPLPSWDGWGDLLADGVKASVVAFAWSLLPSVLLLVPNVAEAGNEGLFILGSLLLNVAVLVITPAALGRVAVRRSLLAGIEGGPVVRLLAPNLGDYLLVRVVTVALIVGVGVAVGLLVLVGVVLGVAIESSAVGAGLALVGGVAALVVLVYVQAVLYHLYGQAYYRAEPSSWHSPPTLD